jgi:aspartate kinase
MMKTARFDGAGDMDSARISDLVSLAGKYPGEKIWLTVTAMDWSAPALQAATDAFCSGHREPALEIFRSFRERILSIAEGLSIMDMSEAVSRMESFFTEVEWLLHDRPVQDRSYYHDQITCIGSLLSSVLVWARLRQEGIPAGWTDARDFLRTDDRFGAATADSRYAASMLAAISEKLFAENDFIVTQAGIGATDENESTTLGMDGENATIALLATCLPAEIIN